MQRFISICRALIATVVLVGLISIPHPYQAESAVEAPNVNAGKVVILSDFNQVLYSVGAHDRVPPASLTKMMTAIVAVRYGDLEQVVTCKRFDLVGEATAGLYEGQRISVGDLLYGLLLPSGNDAAMAIARAVGHREGDQTPAQSVDRFIDMMNQTARELGLRNTHFMNPHGLDQPGHYSSAYDVARLLRAALNYPEIRERMQTPVVRINDSYEIYNGNDLLSMREDYIGGKTGLTDGCGFCLAAAARRNDRMVIAVALRDDWNWFRDVSLLLDHGFALARERGIPTWADPSLVGTQLNQPRAPEIDQAVLGSRTISNRQP